MVAACVGREKSVPNKELAEGVTMACEFESVDATEVMLDVLLDVIAEVVLDIVLDAVAKKSLLILNASFTDVFA